jgi:hypothetical protein
MKKDPYYFFTKATTTILPCNSCGVDASEDCLTECPLHDLGADYA